jgi:hypothetical protein
MGLAFFSRLETVVRLFAAVAIAMKTVEFICAEYKMNLFPIA